MALAAMAKTLCLVCLVSCVSRRPTLRADGNGMQRDGEGVRRLRGWRVAAIQPT